MILVGVDLVKNTKNVIFLINLQYLSYIDSSITIDYSINETLVGFIEILMKGKLFTYFPQTHLFFVLLIFIISIYSSQKLFSPQFFTTHDGGGHIIRMIEFNRAIEEGQFPVRIAKRINYGLGYPFFNFNYPFVYYLGETIHKIGFDFVTVFKILLILSVIVGGISMYFFSTLFFDRFSSFIASLFFTIAPYKFLNMYVRGNIAESLGLAFIPLVLLGIELFVQSNGKKNIIFISSVCLLILSHNISAMIGLFIGFLYFIFRYILLKPHISIQQILASVLFPLLITAFFWIPVMTEVAMTRLNELTSDYKDYFIPLQELIYSPWGFGSYHVGIYPGKMSAQIGIVHQFVLIIAAIIFFKKWRSKKIIQTDYIMFFFLTILGISVFLIIPQSVFLWDNVYYLKHIQLPFRLVGYVVLCLSLLAGYTFFYIKDKKVKYTFFTFLLILLLYANRNHIRVNMYYDFIDPFKMSSIYEQSTTSKNEHMPKWAPAVFNKPNENGDIFPVEKGTSERVVWLSHYHKFVVKADAAVEFRDNTSYFPGWIVKVNGREEHIKYLEDPYGRLKVTVPPGTHVVESFFTEPWYRKMANVMTLVGLVVFFLYSIKKFTKREI